MAFTLTITLPTNPDPYEEALLKSIQPALDTRRAFLNDFPAMSSANAAVQQAQLAYNVARGNYFPGCSDDAIIEFGMASKALKVAQAAAQNLFNSESADSASRNAAWQTLSAAVPQMLVNPGAIEQV